MPWRKPWHWLQHFGDILRQPDWFATVVASAAGAAVAITGAYAIARRQFRHDLNLARKERDANLHMELARAFSRELAAALNDFENMSAATTAQHLQARSPLASLDRLAAASELAWPLSDDLAGATLAPVREMQKRWQVMADEILTSGAGENDEDVVHGVMQVTVYPRETLRNIAHAYARWDGTGDPPHPEAVTPLGYLEHGPMKIAPLRGNGVEVDEYQKWQSRIERWRAHVQRDFRDSVSSAARARPYSQALQELSKKHLASEAERQRQADRDRFGRLVSGSLTKEDIGLEDFTSINDPEG